MNEPIQREAHPAIQVENTTYWSNEKIDLPFSVNEGVQSTLGLFFINPDSPGNNKMHLGVESMHHRTGYLGRVYIRDHEGTLYRDVDLKGIGMIDFSHGEQTLKLFSPTKKGDNDTWGMWRKDKALRERDITEDLIAHGVRTYRMASIIELEQIALPTGELISIQEAKDRGLVNAAEDPVVGVRVYRNRDRIYHEDQNSRVIFEQAKRDVETELGKTLSWEEYINWFAITLGNNLGRIHKTGYWHGFLSAHNLTLACEIIDFGFSDDSKKLEDYDSKKQREFIDIDVADAYSTLSLIPYKLKKLGLIEEDYKVELEKIFTDAYESNR